MYDNDDDRERKETAKERHHRWLKRLTPERRAIEEERDAREHLYEKAHEVHLSIELPCGLWPLLRRTFDPVSRRPFQRKDWSNFRPADCWDHTKMWLRNRRCVRITSEPYTPPTPAFFASVQQLPLVVRVHPTEMSMYFPGSTILIEFMLPEEAERV